MKEKANTILKWAVIGNTAHLIIAVLNTYVEKNSLGIMALMTAVSLLMWLFIGFKMGESSAKSKETDFLLFGIICILPVFLYILIAQLTQGISGELTTLQNYNMFYFLGAPILFWNTPFYPIMNLFSDSNIYVQMNINLLLVLLVVFIGAYVGKEVKIIKIKKNRKKMAYNEN
ncbi:hypothetical protein [Alkalibacter mobilis]|uniref:hypothetical protein n=1 Tax=Alkalibacter mobilis TaxID=2787712 RepID=UPI0018A0D1F4|nr:hypothetical protein [Alkalibacter mobilis]MBF7096073.1 hypothetical protein [Alkalibacter mobilis]